jgi:arylesterase / paraoxonase
MSPDGARIYVAETSGNRISVFARNAASGDLSFVEHLELGSAADNINVDADGSVWIAAHAKVLALGMHFGDASRRAPTQLFRYLPGAKGDARLTEVYLDSGEAISAGSVGAAFNKQLLIGSITDRKILRCQLP